MSPAGYIARKRFSIVAGGRIARVSMFDGRGGEYWRIIDAERPGYRERLDTALEQIEQAMRAGHQPGEVRAAA